MGTEMRGAPRERLLVFFGVERTDDGARVGSLADLSETGLMFMSRSTFEPGARVNLRIQLPEGYGGPQRVDAEVQVVWTRPGRDPERNCVGCRLLLIAPEALHALLEAARACRLDTDFDVTRVAGAR